MLRALRITFLVCVSLLVITTLTVKAQQNATPTVSNVFYGGRTAFSDLLDVYVPGGGTAPYPVVVMFTTSSGSKSDLTDFGIPQFVVGQGYAAVAVGYRAAIPNTYDDAFCALAWVYANADQYSLDTSRIALYGVSWGGMVSAFVAAGDDPTPYLTKCPNLLPADHPLRGVITDSGVFLTVPDEISAFVTNGADPDLAHLPADTLRQTLDTLSGTAPDQWCCLSFPDEVHNALYELPIFHVSGQEPPFLIVQGLGDTTVPYQDTLNFAVALLGQGTNVQLVFDAPSGHVVDLSLYTDQMSSFLNRIFK